MIRVSAPGRVGIIGNPTDMYGGSVISSTIPQRAKVTVEESDELRLETSQDSKAAENKVGSRNLQIASKEDLVPDGGIFDPAKAVVSFLGLEDYKFKMKLETNIPLKAGLAGSTAMIVAILNALLTLIGDVSNKFYRAEIARQIELDFMKVVCGYQDAYMCTFGGINYLDLRDKEFYKGLGEEPYATVESLQPYVGELPFVIAHTGLHHSSSSVHKPIRDRWLEGDVKVVNSYIQMAKLARFGKIALIDGDWEKLGYLMNQNHQLQRNLGGSGPKNEELIQTALECGALGAKLAGAGGGGTIIALKPEPEEMIQRLKEKGAEEIFKPKPAEGVMIETEE